ncbi:MAG: GxxExxY protein [Rhodospirillales bacterium]|nr:GxxExxY protein [Rhodospirillales bacterium]
MHADAIRTTALSERMIACAFRIRDTLETGFRKKVYDNALAHELRQAGLSVALQKGITVYYGSVAVGYYSADLVVEGTVVVDLKAGRTQEPVRTARGIRTDDSANRTRDIRGRVCLSLARRSDARPRPAAGHRCVRRSGLPRRDGGAGTEFSCLGGVVVFLFCSWPTPRPIPPSRVSPSSSKGCATPSRPATAGACWPGR